MTDFPFFMGEASYFKIKFIYSYNRLKLTLYKDRRYINDNYWGLNPQKL
jgi:hypothetical protein